MGHLERGSGTFLRKRWRRIRRRLSSQGDHIKSSPSACGAAPTGQPGDAGRKTPNFQKGQSASSEWARPKGRGRKGDSASRTEACARAGSREGGHVSTLGNPTQVASRGASEPQKAEKWRVLKGKRRVYLGDQAAWPCQEVPQHRANSSGKAHGRLVTSRKFQAQQALPTRPKVTEPQQLAPFTPVSRPRIETCKQDQVQGQSRTAGGCAHKGKRESHRAAAGAAGQFPGTSIRLWASDMQTAPPLWQKVEKN